jgi:hypothetical protein
MGMLMAERLTEPAMIAAHLRLDDTHSVIDVAAGNDL